MGLTRVWRSTGVASTILTIGGIAFLYGSPRATGAQELLLSDGMYSESQASRGERVYRTTCEICHAPNLEEGRRQAPSLLGEPFLEGWDGEVIAELLTLMMDTMPEDAPGSLSAQNYL